MRAWNTVRRSADAVRDTLNRLALRRRRTDFICGDCDRWQRCGLPPDSQCLARAEQLAHADGRAPRRTVLHDWAAWGY